MDKLNCENCDSHFKITITDPCYICFEKAIEDVRKEEREIIIDCIKNSKEKLQRLSKLNGKSEIDVVIDLLEFRSEVAEKLKDGK